MKKRSVASDTNLNPDIEAQGKQKLLQTKSDNIYN